MHVANGMNILEQLFDATLSCVPQMSVNPMLRLGSLKLKVIQIPLSCKLDSHLASNHLVLKFSVASPVLLILLLH